MGGMNGTDQEMAAGMPDLNMFAKMLGSMGLNEENLPKDSKEMDNKMPEVDDEKIKEAQKMFEDCVK